MTAKREIAYKEYNTEETKQDKLILAFSSLRVKSATAQKTLLWFPRTLENKSLSSVVFQISLPSCILESTFVVHTKTLDDSRDSTLKGTRYILLIFARA